MILEQNWSERVTKLIGPILKTEPLSLTNNVVLRVQSRQGDFVVKIVEDRTVDALIEHEVFRCLNDKFFRASLHVEKLDHEGRMLVVSPFLNGVSLDIGITDSQFDDDDRRRWALQMHEAMVQISRISVKGFGRPYVNRPPRFRTWTSFLEWYMERQRFKGPRIAGMRYKRIRGAFDRLHKQFDADVLKPTLVPADVNARNFLICTDCAHLRMIHAPIFWHGDPAVPYGEASVHFGHTSMGKHLLRQIDYPAWRVNWYAAFAAYVILVYSERFDITPLDAVRPWGGGPPLLEILDQNLRRLS